MSYYPELRDFFEGFTDRYTRVTEVGSEITVTGEELQTLSDFLLKGIVDWVEVARSSVEGDCPVLGECLDNFADQYPRGGDVMAAVQVTDEEVIGLGIFLARGFVAWLLRLDQNRGRFKGFDEIIGKTRLSACSHLPRRVIARAL